MKAIEILKEYKTIDYGCDMSDLYERCDEAIKELEELQKSLQSRTCDRCYFDGVIIELEELQNRSCESCKYLKITNSEWGSNGCNHQDIYDYCDDGSYVIPNDFCCNRYEPKDKQ